MPTREVIHLKDIHKSYTDTDEVRVFEGLSMSVWEGEIVGITGPSGSGKTTLMNIVGLIDRPDRGQVHILGKDTMEMGERELSVFRNENIGFVFQYHYLIPELTALENICIPVLIAKKKTPAEDEERCLQVLECVGLSGKVNSLPSELSGGERQRVAVARAIINEPALILADEPTGSLDQENKLKIMSLFTSIRDRYRTTILIATHDMSLLKYMDRVYRIENRKLVETYPPNQ